MKKEKLQKKALKWSAIITKKLDLILLRRKNFCIISNNCWGNGLYEILKREYNTPFVGLFLIPSHYIKFISNIENNIRINLTEDHFKKSDKNYPLATINGCDIHFLHYKSKHEAIGKWNRRRIRFIRYIEKYGINAVIFKVCDRDSNDENLQKEFNTLPFSRKICLTADSENTMLNINNIIVNGIDLFMGRIFYYNKYFKLFSGIPLNKIP